MPEPLPEYPAAPHVLGLRWHTSIMRTTRRGPRRLSKSVGSYAFDDIWGSREGQASLRRLGFDHEFEGNGVLHWGGETPVDRSAVDQIVHQVAVEREADRVEGQQLRERLKHEVETHWWAVPVDRLRQAEAILGRSVMTATDRFNARVYADLIVEGVERAGAAVAKAKVKSTSEDLARCEDPAIREAVHEACRVMSLNDDDRAAISNGMGWSKSTSHRGHWLSELPELDAGLAAVGLALVHRHRRQLRDDLRTVLFPGEQLRRAA